MEKGFAEYYTAKKKNYTFKIKIAKCDLNEEDHKNLDCCLSKYKVVSKGAFKKTPLQENPLDFPSVKNTEVHIVEVTVEYPLTSEVFRREIAEATGINFQSIAVYNKDDPRDQYTKDHLERNSEEFKKNYKPVIGSETPEINLSSPLYGEEYNENFLKSLGEERKKRKTTTVTNDLIPSQKVDNSDLVKGDKPKPNTTSVFNTPRHIDTGKL